MWCRGEEGRSVAALVLCLRVGIPQVIPPHDEDFDRDPSDRRLIAWVGGAIVAVGVLLLLLKALA